MNPFLVLFRIQIDEVRSVLIVAILLSYESSSQFQNNASGICIFWNDESIPKMPIFVLFYASLLVDLCCI